MNPRFILLSTLLGGASLLASAGAHAGALPSVTGFTAPVERVEPDRTTNANGPNPHASNVALNLIDLEDCNADLEYDFPLAFSDVSSGYYLNVWVGNQDCTPLSSRQTSATAVCWPAAPPTTPAGNNETVRVRMRDLVSQAFDVTHTVTYTPTPNLVADPAPALCKAQGSLPATDLRLYFFFADASGNAVGLAQPYPLTVDLVANPAPVTQPDGGTTDAGPVPTSGGNGCTVASGPSSPSTAFTLAFAVGAVALLRRRQRATGTRRGWASRSSSRSA